MLKIIYKVIVSLIFILSLSLQSGGNLMGEKNHTFYLYSKSSSAKITTLPERDADSFIYLKGCLKGESVEFLSEQNALAFLNNLCAKLVFCETGEDFLCHYYYSEKISDYVIIRGQRVNLHLSCGKGVWTVGSPLIFGSF
ncbi:MAG: hypothetical protein IKA61_02155 [Clostridia bacterium]|nr:hypothetical protein [Clostridia bacterium]